MGSHAPAAAEALAVLAPSPPHRLPPDPIRDYGSLVTGITGHVTGIASPTGDSRTSWVTGITSQVTGII